MLGTASVRSDLTQSIAPKTGTMTRVSEERDEQPVEDFHWDLATVLRLALVVLLLAWITSKLWLPQ